jgi:hypothetical protein
VGGSVRIQRHPLLFGPPALNNTHFSEYSVILEDIGPPQDKKEVPETEEKLINNQNKSHAAQYTRD